MLAVRNTVSHMLFRTAADGADVLVTVGPTADLTGRNAVFDDDTAAAGGANFFGFHKKTSLSVCF